MALDPAAAQAMAERYADAWSSHSAEAVASFYSAEGRISINRGDPIVGRAALAEMAQGFYDEFPDLVVRCDGIRLAGDHALFLWTLEGTHNVSGNSVKISGWEEWTLSGGLQVENSLGWFDAEDYDRQVAGQGV